MKNYLHLSIVAMGFLTTCFFATSCTSIQKTARTETLPYAMYNATVAELEVSPERISYTMEPTKEIRKFGTANCKKACISEVLTANGNADILVEPQFVIESKKTIGPAKVKRITVTGRPAKYKAFRSLPDSVWCNPIFRGRDVQYIIK